MLEPHTDFLKLILDKDVTNIISFLQRNKLTSNIQLNSIFLFLYRNRGDLNREPLKSLKNQLLFQPKALEYLIEKVSENDFDFYGLLLNDNKLEFNDNIIRYKEYCNQAILEDTGISVSKKQYEALVNYKIYKTIVETIPNTEEVEF